jgi:hypothetical protein
MQERTKPKLTKEDIRAIIAAARRQEDLKRQIDTAYDRNDIAEIMDLLPKLLGKEKKKHTIH